MFQNSGLVIKTRLSLPNFEKCSNWEKYVNDPEVTVKLNHILHTNIAGQVSILE